ncbi:MULTISPECIES: Panacea domain-containing protein [Pseudomonas]|uniref:Panacea domain-containing protein n=1 Tax=Pseudomonas TaxID=286 RepID=UPI000C125FBB|nr:MULTISPECIES: type II toxin-antitoxin system antitoxin SocA domain-containing protein [Pseudomonas]ATP52774.1 hypothetical protein CR512_26910 [Pseudomonas putida]USS55984.1 DUF4065 domain-containing protein [Pseudomonas kermanshahensis]UVL66868.1 DUF4065 domain-containing protein [Pseudomonas sp. B21-031]GHS79686.1 hypothetical protein PAGU2196_05200 [Pseudomonas sp. PAGU 2196]GLO54154.1 hypothetical protein PPUJ20066_01900 [Pseudomonas putida]
MAYSALAVANAFIERARKGEIRNLTPMKLQKLLFYTQSWHLRLNGERSPLIDDNFARWKFGPVIPSLYHELKSYGAQEVTSLIKNINFDSDGDAILITPTVPKSDQATHNLIDKIISKYGKLTGTELSNLTHEAGTAWAEGDADGSPITWGEMAQKIHPESRFSGKE